MIKYKWLIGIGASMLLLLFFYFGYFRTGIHDETQLKNFTCPRCKSYYIPVQLSHVSVGNTPHINVEIEGKTFCMLLDLGSDGYLSLDKNVLQHLSSKHFLGKAARHNVIGKSYLADFYRIQQISIGIFTLSDLPVEEENEEHKFDGTFVSQKKKSKYKCSGKIGWKFFKKLNLFLDLKNNYVVFCDSIDTLQSKNLNQFFTKIPLNIERELTIEVGTNEGPLRCLLDTGCTWNLKKDISENGKTVYEAISDQKHAFSYSNFKIGKENFGAIKFHKAPIELPDEAEAVLGMEFFLEHIVFIDFKEKQIYFAKAE